MTPDQIRRMAEDGNLRMDQANLLRACADLVEASAIMNGGIRESIHHAPTADPRHCRICQAWSAIQEMMP